MGSCWFIRKGKDCLFLIWNDDDVVPSMFVLCYVMCYCRVSTISFCAGLHRVGNTVRSVYIYFWIKWEISIGAIFNNIQSLLLWYAFHNTGIEVWSGWALKSSIVRMHIIIIYGYIYTVHKLHLNQECGIPSWSLHQLIETIL